MDAVLHGVFHHPQRIDARLVFGIFGRARGRAQPLPERHRRFAPADIGDLPAGPAAFLQRTRNLLRQNGRRGKTHVIQPPCLFRHVFQKDIGHKKHGGLAGHQHENPRRIVAVPIGQEAHVAMRFRGRPHGTSLRVQHQRVKTVFRKIRLHKAAAFRKHVSVDNQHDFSP